MLAYLDFYRMDSKIKEEHGSKRKICHQVKKVILNVVRITVQNFNQTIAKNQQLFHLMNEIFNKWNWEVIKEAENEQTILFDEVEESL